MANRLRALWSAYAFSLRHHSPVLLLWPVLPELGCNWQELFTLPSRLPVINVDPNRRPSGLALRVARVVMSSFRVGLNQPVEQGAHWGKAPVYKPGLVPFQWIQTCTAFEDFSNIAPPFSPLDSLSDQATELVTIARANPGRLIGVHIRRGDHVRSTRASTLGLFADAMTCELELNPETRFIVCTDSPTEVEFLVQLFGDRLFWRRPCSLARNEVMGMREAMVDFLALSQCDCILGSYQSSFSLLAAAYGQIPVNSVGGPEYQLPIPG